jgi:hypothetical protein
MIDIILYILAIFLAISIILLMIAIWKEMDKLGEVTVLMVFVGVGFTIGYIITDFITVLLGL